MNECLTAAVDELARHGITRYATERGGKHLKVKWFHHGQERIHTVALTSSDWRAALNVRSQVRNTLKADGLSPLKPLPKQERHRKQEDTPLSRLERQVDILQSEVETVSELLLDTVPKLEKIEKIGTPTDDVPFFRLRVDLPTGFVGDMFAFLVSRGLSLNSVRIAPLPTQSTDVLKSPVPTITPAAQELSTIQLKATFRQPRLISGRLRYNRDRVIWHLYNHGPRTFDQIRSARLITPDATDNYLHTLLGKLRTEGYIETKHRDYSLTPLGRKIAVEFILPLIKPTARLAA
jgi:hypothetical protein